jgi:hypothetical protein
MRDVDVVHDHQRSAQDAIALRLPLSCTDIVGRMEADPFPVSDVGDAVGDRDSGEGGGLLHSFPIDSLTQTVTTDDDRGVPEVRQRGRQSCIELEDVIARGDTVAYPLKDSSIFRVFHLSHLLTQDDDGIEASPEIMP